jgi:hypothetical protein
MADGQIGSNSQLSISGQCTFPDRILLDERIGDLSLIEKASDGLRLPTEISERIALIRSDAQVTHFNRTGVSLIGTKPFLLYNNHLFQHSLKLCKLRPPASAPLCLLPQPGNVPD